MAFETEFKSIERKTYLTFFEDGIADFIAGLPILFFGLGMTFDESMFFILAWMPILFFWPLKRWITYPRIGYVKFSPERQKKISTGFALLLVAGTLSLLLGIAMFMGFEGMIFDLQGFMREYSLLVLGAVLAGAYVLVAILFEAKRFYIYGFFVFSGWLTGYLFVVNPGIPVAASGAIISIIGIGLLLRFRAKYPLPAEG